MAYDEGLAQIFRDDLADHANISEKKMFGGLCFLINGNMLCGVMAQSVMFRVGKDHEPQALAIKGLQPLSFTGRKMGGILEAQGDIMEDDENRLRALKLALDFAGNLPAK